MAALLPRNGLMFLGPAVGRPIAGDGSARRWLVKFTLTAVLALLGSAPAAYASSFWGVGASGMLEQTPAAAAMHLTLTRSAGISLGRFGVFADSDAQVAALAEHGIEPYPMLSGSYGAFAKQYGVGGTYWTAAVDPVHIYEIGNEPNIAQSPAHYAAKFRDANSEILAQDPGAYVVAGGLAAIYPGAYRFDVYDWTRQMITALGFCPAAIGYHAYAWSLAQLQTGLQNERTALDSVNCTGTNIELNEFYMLGGDPQALTDALSWITTSALNVSRVVLSMWCAPPAPASKMFPAETTDGVITPLGDAFVATVAAFAASGPLPVTAIPSVPSPPTTASHVIHRRAPGRHHRNRHCHPLHRHNQHVHSRSFGRLGAR